MAILFETEQQVYTLITEQKLRPNDVIYNVVLNENSEVVDYLLSKVEDLEYIYTVINPEDVCEDEEFFNDNEEEIKIHSVAEGNIILKGGDIYKGKLLKKQWTKTLFVDEKMTVEVLGKHVEKFPKLFAFSIIYTNVIKFCDCCKVSDEILNKVKGYKLDFNEIMLILTSIKNKKSQNSLLSLLESIIGDGEDIFIKRLTKLVKNHLNVDIIKHLETLPQFRDIIETFKIVLDIDRTEIDKLFKEYVPEYTSTYDDTNGDIVNYDSGAYDSNGDMLKYFSRKDCMILTQRQFEKRREDLINDVILIKTKV